MLVLVLLCLAVAEAVLSTPVDPVCKYSLLLQLAMLLDPADLFVPLSWFQVLLLDPV